MTTDDNPFETEAGQAFLAAAADPAVDRKVLYQLKNANLELSLAAAEEWSGPLYSEQIPWLEEILGTLKPAVVIDVGCEQGLLTKVIAEALPDAEVRGVDRCAEAIALAEEAAPHWAAPAPAFHVWDVRDAWHAEFAAGKVGLIHASRSLLGEAIAPDAEDPAELLPGTVLASGEWLREARALAGRFGFGTEPGSILVSVERSGLSGALRWAKVLGEHGFKLLPGQSRLLPAPEPMQPGLMLPAMVFEHVDGPGVEITAAELAAALVSLPSPSDPGPHTGFEGDALAIDARRGECLCSLSWHGDTSRAELWRMPEEHLVEVRMDEAAGTVVWLLPDWNEAESVERITQEASALANGRQTSCEPFSCA
jgi:SAM-dependent methyltransferase